MSDKLDPDIAALVGDLGSTSTTSSDPSFESLFGDMSVNGDEKAKGEFDIDLSKKAYNPVTKFESDTPNTYFQDPQFYQKALSNEGEGSKRFHELLKKYLQATDPKDRGMYRQQVITAYWNMISNMVPRLVNVQPGNPKQLMMRFGIALPTMLAPEQRDIFSNVIIEKSTIEPVYYFDEWLRAIAKGQINPSSTDEVSSSGRDERTRFKNLLSKALGKRETAEALLKAKAEERKHYEEMFKSRFDLITEHNGFPGFMHIPAPYTDSQKKTIQECTELFKKMLSADKELVTSSVTFEESSKDVDSIKEKMGALGEDSETDIESLKQEFETTRQMLKMCVGRQGNHFPLLSKEYFHLNIREMGTRENVLNTLAWLESIDTQAYCRPYKNSLNRIEPYVILLPCYGDSGVCWEPFDKYNRHTSRSRLAIPMFPKNLKIAIATAVADMRWQAAKEKASYYWMEEGLTGQYYQWFTKQKLKGDVKEFFVQDYIMWVTKESEGIQKLDKEVRGTFWRLMPFSKEIREKLRERSLVYQELYQKDINRSLSDGY